MNKKNIDLGKSLYKLRLQEQIQKQIMALTSNSIMALSLKKAAIEDLNGCIDMIINTYSDNPYSICELVGESTMKLIEEFTGITLEFISVKPDNAMTQDEIDLMFERRIDDVLTKERKPIFTEEELKALDEEDTDDPDRRYHR